MEIPHFYPGRFRFSCRLKTGAGGPLGQPGVQVAAGFPSRDPPPSSQRRTALRSKVTTGRRETERRGELPPGTTWEVSCAPLVATLLHWDCNHGFTGAWELGQKFTGGNRGNFTASTHNTFPNWVSQSLTNAHHRSHISHSFFNKKPAS